MHVDLYHLSKWTQAGEKLGTDACFEFSPEPALEKTHALRNANIALNSTTYNPKHSYESLAFLARTNKIHFWVDDTSYDDNSGAFRVKIIKVDEAQNEQK